MNLKSIRNKIDFLDSKILQLLNDRMEQALLAKKFKPEVEDPGREEELLKKVKHNSRGLINPEFCNSLYKEILNESKRLQEKDHQLIAFQGEHGAYGEAAARKWNSKLIPVACKEFVDVFDGVKEGYYDYGIVPVENTLGGVVGPVNSLLISTTLHVTGAVEFSIEHCLLALPEANHREIKTVYSHPQALSQCRQFLARNNLEPASYYDTAGAVRMVADSHSTTSAAIAGKFAAELYNMEILKEHIEDLPENKTRFLILSKNENKKEGGKCSVLFNTEHKSGTLYNVLKVFADAALNLTRIESIPDDPGKYAFFLDFIGNKKDDNTRKAIKEVESITANFRLLGCYNEIKG